MAQESPHWSLPCRERRRAGTMLVTVRDGELVVTLGIAHVREQ